MGDKKREYYVENNIEWLRKNHKEWKGLNGIGACVSTVTYKGKTTTAVSYSIYRAVEKWEQRNMEKVKGHIGE